jgi:hypothetical protein
MNLSSITPQIVTQRVVVDQPTIFLLFPDTNTKIWNSIYHTNFLLANCDGIICPPKIVSFLRRKFNGRIHALEFKKQLITLESASKKLKVLNSIHEKTKDVKKNFYFYDLSIYSDAILSLKDKMSVNQLTIEMITQIGKTYQNLKSNFPNYNINLVFLVQNNTGYLTELFKNIKVALPKDKLSAYNFFDDFVFVSTTNKFLIPIMHRVEGKTEYISQNINKLEGYYLADETESKEKIINSKDETKEITNSTDPSNQTSNETDVNKQNVDNPVSKLTSDLVDKDIKTKTKVDDDGNIEVEINIKQLKKILKLHDIDDPAILSNVKVVIDKYLAKDKTKVKRDEVEVLILKAINKTIHGTDVLRDDYIENPALLFNKLKNTKTYQVPLEFPEYENELIQPKDIIDLDYTCGQHRQKFEFTETVHANVEKLFKTLENTTSYPIKILKIDHEIIDNNKDRLIEYTIQVQNMAGGYPKPYELKMRIPGLVSERYFKLRGSHYIQKTQQFLKPLTKTDPNEIRLLSSYAIVRISLKNFKFSSGNIGELLNYVRIKYPSLIIEETEDFVKFVDDDMIGLTGNLVFKTHDDSIKIEVDKDTNSLVDLAGQKVSGSKYEYQLDIIFEKIKLMNPAETLNRSKLKITYLEIYLGGVIIPLILYLWSQKGLLITLNDESIKYSIDNEIDKKAGYTLKTKAQFLNIYPETFRQKCFVNGLIILNLKDVITGDLNNPDSSYDVITNYTKSSGAIRMIGNMTENEIDPITKDLLEFEGLSTNFVKLVSKNAVDKLFNQTPDNLSDLSIYRTRLSEMIFATMYKQLTMSKNTYRNKVFNFEDPEAKIEIFEDYIVQNMITTSAVLQNIEAYNPIDEIMLASRCIKSGKGGVPLTIGGSR